MKKALLIILAIAILGILAAYVNPLGPEKRQRVSTGGSRKGTASEAAPPASSSTSSNVPAGSTAQSGGYKDGIYHGNDYSSRYGGVQVSVTVHDGKISEISFDQLTAFDNRSQEINDSAAPQLKDQTLAAQSASIDGVSGATYTSTDYIKSLQSALDQARV